MQQDTHTVHTQTQEDTHISQVTLSNRPVTFSSEVLNLLVTTAIVFCNKWLVDAVNGMSDIEGSTKKDILYGKAVETDEQVHFI